MWQLFGYVLEYLRGYAHRDVETVELPCEISKLKALKREATFYRLPELVSQIQSRLQVLHTSACSVANAVP